MTCVKRIEQCGHAEVRDDFFVRWYGGWVSVWRVWPGRVEESFQMYLLWAELPVLVLIEAVWWGRGGRGGRRSGWWVQAAGCGKLVTSVETRSRVR